LYACPKKEKMDENLKAAEKLYHTYAPLLGWTTEGDMRLKDEIIALMAASSLDTATAAVNKAWRASKDTIF